ncbi:hypothetical protein AB0M48_36165 [Lentzea sp. NPDC051208]|uniref:hypothetical protein n=1 Tax=Lentzea sp. NPDC051208 TaxID=3154642 RepID=UPI003426C4E7
MSAFGEWTTVGGLPAFEYRAGPRPWDPVIDPPTSRHWVQTLHAHTAAYPEVWTGTLSGPDCYLAPDSDRPGETWALPDFGTAMQAYPVANLHSHSQSLLALLRLLGIPRFGEWA